MIVNIELTQSGTDKFNAFFAQNAKESVSMQAVLSEALDIFQERASMEETLSYELGKSYTNSGNPAILTLDDADVLIETADDDE